MVLVADQGGYSVQHSFDAATIGWVIGCGSMRTILLTQCLVVGAWCKALQFITSTSISLAVLKMGGELVHPIRSVNGNAMVVPLLSVRGRMTPSFGMLNTQRPIQ